MIAAVPAGKTLGMDVCDRAARSNPDGWGVAWVHAGKLHVVREMNSIKRFKKRVRRACRSGGPVLVHFRFATHGSVCMENTHPFVIESNTVVAHNGILWGYGADLKSDKSDTADFVETVLKRHPALVQSPAGNEMLSKAIGQGNKLAFLSVARGLTLINEAAGIWDGGIWYSNGGYKERTWDDAEYYQGLRYPRYVRNAAGTYDEYDNDGAEDIVASPSTRGWVVNQSTVMCDCCLLDYPEFRDAAYPYEIEGAQYNFCDMCGELLEDACDDDVLVSATYDAERKDNVGFEEWLDDIDVPGTAMCRR